MSAGTDILGDAATALTVQHSLGLLAPKMRSAVEAALVDAQGLDPWVYETYRSDPLQRLYYRRGRTIKPPYTPVTNAPDNLSSWHGYGLAVDVIHRVKRWDAGSEWFREVAAIFKRHNLDWGGDWQHPDLPHFQWGYCRPSPSTRARDLLLAGGLEAVWREVGAL